MKKTCCTIIISLLFGCGLYLFPERLAELPEIMKPSYFLVDNDQLYVVEGTSIHLYSMKDFKRIKQFGKKGEGPGEFKNTPGVGVSPDYLMAYERGKFTFFSRTGEFIKEKKIMSRSISGVLPLGKHLIAYESKIDRNTHKTTSHISIYDNDLKVIKELAVSNRKFRGMKAGKMEIHPVQDKFFFQMTAKNIFIGDTTKGFFIEVFDLNGNKLYKIKKEYEKIPVDEEYKKKIVEPMEKHPAFKRNRDRFLIVFPEFFPAFGSFKIDNEKLLAITHKKKDNKKEIIVMDFKGNVLKTVSVPDEKLYSIHNGHFYYLKENQEETWELHSEKL